MGFDLKRSSLVVRRWAAARGHAVLAAEWAAKGSPEYYSELSRGPATTVLSLPASATDGFLTFADGNATSRRRIV
jgi:hypothetical protein